nr:retrovirus-related Pol polyprotein from transposon TNT 1-94 [Tanacetum cinerariifolium]
MARKGYIYNSLYSPKWAMEWANMEYSNARTPQQNGVAERKNKTLIEAARTMLADSFLPSTFWAETVNTACYVLNRVLVTNPQNKTPYELLTGRQPIISYLRPFGCHVTILNTINHLGKFDEKSDSGFLVGYSLNSKAFRVYNLETKRVEENLHVNFLENKPNVAGKGHAWMFDLDYLTNFMNYEPVSIENQANKSAGLKEANNSVGTKAYNAQGANSEEINLHDEHFVLPIWSTYSTTVKSSGTKTEKTTDYKTCEKPVSQVKQIFQEELEKLKRQEKEVNDEVRKEATHENQNANTNNTNLLNVVSTPISTAGPSIALNNGEPSYPDDPSMPHLEDIYASPSEGIFTDSSYDDEGASGDFGLLVEGSSNTRPGLFKVRLNA